MGKTGKNWIGCVVIGVLGAVGVLPLATPALRAILRWAMTDDAGRIVLSPRGSPIELVYDPNAHNPGIGLRKSVARILTCMNGIGDVDECVKRTPKCVSAKPWKGDPAGDDCCPESCAREYFEHRKTESVDQALTELSHGLCYPGTKELMAGKEP